MTVRQDSASKWTPEGPRTCRRRYVPGRFFLVMVGAMAGLLLAGCPPEEGTPTAPEPQPVVDVAGRWQGSWTPDAEIAVTMDLQQSASIVDGTLTLLDSSFRVRGRIEDQQPASPTLIWNVTGAGCGTFSGRLRVAGDRMAGPATLDTSGCEDSGRFQGDMRLERTSLALGLDDYRPATLEGVARGLASSTIGSPSGLE